MNIVRPIRALAVLCSAVFLFSSTSFAQSVQISAQWQSTQVPTIQFVNATTVGLPINGIYAAVCAETQRGNLVPISEAYQLVALSPPLATLIHPFTPTHYPCTAGSVRVGLDVYTHVVSPLSPTQTQLSTLAFARCDASGQSFGMLFDVAELFRVGPALTHTYPFNPI